MLEKFKNLFTLNVFSALLGIIGILFSIYTYYFTGKKDLQITILDTIDLVNVNEPLKKIDFKYDGRNIYDEKLSLQLLRVKFENIGNDIKESDFSDKSIFGIELKNAEIIELRDFDSSTEYIKNELKPKLENKNLISFEKIMIDSSNYFIINFVILKDSTNNLEFNILGKVSGQNNLEISYEKPKNTFDLVIQFYNNYPLIFLILFISFSIIITILLLFFIAGLVEIVGKIEKFFTKYKQNKYFGKIGLEYYHLNYGRSYDSSFLTSLLLNSKNLEKSEIVNLLLYSLYKSKCLKLFEHFYKNKIEEFIEFYNNYFKLKNQIENLKKLISEKDYNTVINETYNINLSSIFATNKYTIFKELISTEHKQLLLELDEKEIELNKLFNNTKMNVLFPKSNYLIENDLNTALEEYLKKNIFIKKKMD